MWCSGTVKTVAIATTLVGGAMIAMLPQQAQAALTLARYLENADTNEEQGEIVNLLYLTAVLDGLTTANQVALARGRPLFCANNPTSPLRVATFQNFIDDSIAYERRAHEDFERYSQTVTLGALGLQILVDVFPCDDEALSAIVPPDRAADAVLDRLFETED